MISGASHGPPHVPGRIGRGARRAVLVRADGRRSRRTAPIVRAPNPRRLPPTPRRDPGRAPGRERTAARLDELGARHRALVAQLPAISYVQRIDGHAATVDISPQVETILGWSVGEVLGDPHRWLALLHPDDRDRVLREDDQSNATRETFDVEYRLIGRDGRAVWVRDLAALVEDGDDGKVYWQGVQLDITRQKAAEIALRRSEAGLNEAQRLARLGSWEVDLVGGGLVWSAGNAAIFGVDPTDLPPSWEAFLALIRADDRPRLSAALDAALAGGGAHVTEFRIGPTDGSERIVQGRIEADRDGTGRPLRLRGINQNVTERQRAEAALRHSEARFRALVQHATDMVSIVAADGAVRFVTPASERLLGYRREHLVGRPVIAFVHPDDVKRVRREFRAVLADPGRIGRTDMRVRHRDGGYRHLEITVTNLMAEPAVAGMVVNARDVTEGKAVEARLAHQAFHDTLTGLPNRTLVVDRLRRALAAAAASGGQVAVLFLDLDRFKLVNDSLGHDAGDRLLVAVAARLRSALGPEVTLGRFGGDEFAILLEHSATPEEAVRVAERVVAALGDPLPVDGHDIHVGATLGVALGGGERRPADLLRDADTALYHARQVGRAPYALFAPSLKSAAVERLDLEHDLHGAIERHEIAVHFQPIVSLASGRVSAYEALARWFHPDRGWVAPAEFIPVAEETGLIVPLGRSVLAQAVRFAAGDEGGARRRVSVNLSARQFRSPTLVDEIAAVLQTTGLPPDRLALEVTEGVLVDDVVGAVDVFARLRTLGVRLAIDDFGAGYSSLAYLQRLPVDALKIDRSFVHGLGREPDTTIVGTMINLGRALGLEVVAEGIETPDQLDRLRGLGCDAVQGFLIGRPAPPPGPPRAPEPIAPGISLPTRFPGASTPVLTRVRPPAGPTSAPNVR